MSVGVWGLGLWGLELRALGPFATGQQGFYGWQRSKANCIRKHMITLSRRFFMPLAALLLMVLSIDHNDERASTGPHYNCHGATVAVATTTALAR